MPTLTVLFDFKSPHAYLALAPTLKMLDELAITADWQPLLVAPQQRPVEPELADDRGGMHRWHRACYRLADLRRYAAVQGMPDDCFSDARLFDCGSGQVAAAAFLWAQQQFPDQHQKLLAGLFVQFWNGELDVNSVTEVDQAMTGLVGQDSGFSGHSEQALIELAALQEQQAQAGQFDVPGYLVDDNLYYGRQHLPMVRWLLQGGEGHPPAWGRYN